jgi:hypothetical protein
MYYETRCALKNAVTELVGGAVSLSENDQRRTVSLEDVAAATRFYQWRCYGVDAAGLCVGLARETLRITPDEIAEWRAEREADEADDEADGEGE